MPRAGRLGAEILAMLLLMCAMARPQEVVDRIVARIENDIILLSQVQQLSRYQLFLDGKSESNSQILERLIDQWIVRNEASVARFPQPSDAEVDKSLANLKRSFASPEEYQARKKQSGLGEEELRELVKSQIYQSNYLDTRFRPSTQIEDKDIEEFYKTRVVPRAESRRQTPPGLEEAREFIQEALVQKAINEQSDQWLKESRARVRVEKLLDGGGAI
jgi:parvulin-like peptidyl-prolyl isomerase